MKGSSRKGKHAYRYSTLALIAVGCVSLAVGLAIGINDNLPGLALVYVAVLAWMLAFAHRWRRAKSFLFLLAASLVGFPLFVVLHNLFYALAELASDVVVLSQVLTFLEVGFFLIGLFVCPPGVLIGATGSVVLALSHWRRRRTSD
jgi:hypothetical protein